jgi:hypothetical protein
MDLNQTQLFDAIDRSAMMNNLEKTTRIMNYTGRVNLYSNANNPYQRYSQLDISSYLGCFATFTITRTSHKLHPSQK